MWSVDIELLEDRGPQIGPPIADTVTMSRYRTMKAVRPGASGHSELRILFPFDPERSAIMPITGDKAGSRSRWHMKSIPLVDDLFYDHPRGLRGERPRGP